MTFFKQKIFCGITFPIKQECRALLAAGLDQRAPLPFMAFELQLAFV